jgi:hypothetical protein
VVDWIEETVSLPNQTVEVGQWANLAGVLGRIITDDGQPETQFRQSYRCRGLIYPEEATLKHAPLLFGCIAAGMRDGQAFQSTQQEGARSHSWVEQRDSGQSSRCFRIRVERPALGLRVATAKTVREERRETGIQHLHHHPCRGVEGARHMANVWRHDSLEHAAEHIRCYAAMAAGLGDGEVEPLEQSVEGVTPKVVGDVGTEALLEGVWLEEPPVQKRDISKGGCNPAPTDRRPIESAEEQRS